MPDLASYLSNIKNHEILISFRGVMDKRDINEIIHQAENRLKDIEGELKMRKKIFNVLVEAIQNIYHHNIHSDLSDSPYKKVQFLLVKVDSGYRILTSNHVLSKNIKEITMRLEETNALTPDQIKEYYRVQLDSGEMSDKGGAGLGLIDMFRKSGKRLNYWFEKVNPEFSLFCLEVSINS
jgi:hypothetical protein